MVVIPGGVETNTQPPMTVPLRHFVVGLGFLVVGGIVGMALPLGVLGGRPDVAYVHLFLIGWVCVTIMGAMTQFVPVWSGTTLHSTRLATIQLWLVIAGLLGFIVSLLLGRYDVLSLFGVLMLAGFWVFVYNIARTLGGVRPWDVTERHFAIALGFFATVTAFGALLAISYSHPHTVTVGSRGVLRSTHTTLAVFGAVLTTVIGAVYQLGTMFTQSELYGIDHTLKRVEEIGYPLGVLSLAMGRLFEWTLLGQFGGVLVIGGLLSVSVILGRRLLETTVPWTPMLRRYVVVAVSMGAWAVLAFPRWVQDPISNQGIFGSPALRNLLFLGVVGFVVIGTVYHVVPFIIWVHRYSDSLGLQAVPMIDDLYDHRLSKIDFVCVLTGGSVLVVSQWISVPPFVEPLGRLVVLSGFLVFALNMLLVITEHSPQSLRSIFFSSMMTGSTARPSDGD